MMTFSIFLFQTLSQLILFFTYQLTAISLFLNIVSKIHLNKQKSSHFISNLQKKKKIHNQNLIYLTQQQQSYQLVKNIKQKKSKKIDLLKNHKQKKKCINSHQVANNPINKNSHKNHKKNYQETYLHSLDKRHVSQTLIDQNSNCNININDRNSIGSGKSRESRDSDLLNRLAKESSKASSKSLSRNVSYQYFVHEKQHQKEHKSQMNSSKSNSIISESQKSVGKEIKIEGKDKQAHDIKNKVIETQKMAPRIHNCVCMVAGECLGYYCNCFLSPYPCAPDCCQNCLTLKSSLPLKFSNVCSCKKTRCLKLYCECLAKGLYCNPMCQCSMCQNHEHSISRIESIDNYQMYRGCSCQKSHCRKKYCDCFAQGIKCTSKCVCIDCHNLLQLKQLGTKMQVENDERGNTEQKMDEQNEKEEEQMQFEAIDFFGHQNKRKK